METVIRAQGHENVAARHTSTFEVTSDDHLTPAGDCIVGVSADRVPAGFDPAFVRACRDPAASIQATVRVGDHTQVVRGRGHPDLSFASTRSLVGRTSTYIDERTVMIGADHAAADFDRRLVSALTDGAPLELVLSVS